LTHKDATLFTRLDCLVVVLIAGIVLAGILCQMALLR
jgi:hypothetical protein